MFTKCVQIGGGTSDPTYSIKGTYKLSNNSVTETIDLTKVYLVTGIDGSHTLSIFFMVKDGVVTEISEDTGMTIKLQVTLSGTTLTIKGTSGSWTIYSNLIEIS